MAPARWRLALRFARREVQRRPGRTVLVALLIAVPIMGMTLGSVYAHTVDDSGDWEFQLRYGAQADIAAQGAASGKSSALKGVEKMLPEGSTVTRVIGGLYLPVRRQNGDTPRVTLLQFNRAPTDGAESLGMEPADVPQAGEAWVSRHLLAEFDLEVGDRLTLQYPRGSWTISGTGKPGADHRENVIVFADFPLEQFRREFIGRTTIIDLPQADGAERQQLADAIQARYQDVYPELPERIGSSGDGADSTALAWGWVAGIIALAAVGIVISAAFATSARRQLVMVGQLSANGAPQRLIGRALGLQGFWTGLAGVALGMTGAVLIGVFGRSTIERLYARDLPSFQYVPRDLVVIALTGIAAAVVAAYVPARSAAKVPTLTALAGRRPLGKVPVRLVPIGAVTFGFGVLLLVLAAGSNGGGNTVAAAGV
ncbi:MAG: FtsX-like permease family protein, partial [Ilumatobacteraceae bacterium]